MRGDSVVDNFYVDQPGSVRPLDPDPGYIESPDTGSNSGGKIFGGISSVSIRINALILVGLLTLSGCKRPLVEPPQGVGPAATAAESVPSPTSTARARGTPTPAATATPSPPPALVIAPDPPRLTSAGRTLIYEFEVGGKSGYNPRPEAPDARLSGITWGIGYDAHQNSPAIIVSDWAGLGAPKATRLAATHPYYGASAQAHLHEVRDILVAWELASGVFDRIDVGREFAAAHRNWPGFDELRPNAQAALISNAFNRGWSVVGANRAEMREMKRLVPLKDYAGIATQLRKSSRVWLGTEIYNGLRRRRYAEAVLCETP